MSLTNLSRKILYIVYLLLSTFILLEIIFRILPTSTPATLKPVNKEEDILRFHPYQETTYSLGANFYNVVKKSTNNYGFFSSVDYEPNSEPDLVVIGDSFVEGAQLSNKDTIGEVIASKAKDINVYQLGVPGVPIAQFIHMVRYAEKEFQPKNYLIVITSNDFDESICEYRINLGAWCFNDNFKLKFVPFEGHGLIRKIAQNSAFLRYIVFNLNIDWRLFIRTDDGVNNIDKYAGNTERIKSKVLVDSSKKVIESFFEFIKKMKLNDKVTLIVDTDRQDIYGQKNTDSYFRDMRSFLKKMAVINQVTIIDLEEVFMEDFNNYGKRFEFPTDGHWNKRAHRLAAEAYLNKQ